MRECSQSRIHIVSEEGNDQQRNEEGSEHSGIRINDLDLFLQQDNFVDKLSRIIGWAKLARAIGVCLG